MKSIKFITDNPLDQTFARIAVRCIEKGYYLPHSYCHLMVLVDACSGTMTVKEIARLAVQRQIVYSEQVVYNYLSTLRNFGLIERNGKNKRKLSDDLIK